MTNINKPSLVKIILLSGTGFFMFVCMDSLAKYLGGVMPITQAVWGRFFFHFIALVIYFLIFRPKINSGLKTFMLGPSENMINPKLITINNKPFKLKTSFKKIADNIATINGAEKNTT